MPTPSGIIFYLAPYAASIVGRDEGDDGPADASASALYDERAKNAPDEALCANLKLVWLNEVARGAENPAANVTPVQLRHVTDAHGAATEALEYVDGRNREICARWLEDNDAECKGITLQAMINEAADQSEEGARAAVIIANVRIDDNHVVRAQKVTRHVAALMNERRAPVAGQIGAITVERDMTEEQAIQQSAIFFACSDNTIRNRLRLLKSVCSDVLKMVAKGDLGVSQALAIADQSESEQVRLAVELAASGATKEEARRKAKDVVVDDDAAVDEVALSPWTIKQIRLAAGLASEDGAKNMPCKASTLLVLRVLVGELDPSEVDGMSELLTRIEAGESPGAEEKARAVAERAKEKIVSDALRAKTKAAETKIKVEAAAKLFALKSETPANAKISAKAKIKPSKAKSAKS